LCLKTEIPSLTIKQRESLREIATRQNCRSSLPELSVCKDLEINKLEFPIYFSQLGRDDSAKDNNECVSADIRI